VELPYQLDLFVKFIISQLALYTTEIEADYTVTDRGTSTKAFSIVNDLCELSDDTIGKLPLLQEKYKSSLKDRVDSIGAWNLFQMINETNLAVKVYQSELNELNYEERIAHSLPYSIVCRTGFIKI
jgi:hypothetical protein